MALISEDCTNFFLGRATLNSDPVPLFTSCLQTPGEFAVRVYFSVIDNSRDAVIVFSFIPGFDDKNLSIYLIVRKAANQSETNAQLIYSTAEQNAAYNFGISSIQPVPVASSVMTDENLSYSSSRVPFSTETNALVFTGSADTFTVWRYDTGEKLFSAGVRDLNDFNNLQINTSLSSDILTENALVRGNVNAPVPNPFPYLNAKQSGATWLAQGRPNEFTASSWLPSVNINTASTLNIAFILQLNRERLSDLQSCTLNFYSSKFNWPIFYIHFSRPSGTTNTLRVQFIKPILNTKEFAQVGNFNPNQNIVAQNSAIMDTEVVLNDIEYFNLVFNTSQGKITLQRVGNPDGSKWSILQRSNPTFFDVKSFTLFTNYIPFFIAYNVSFATANPLEFQVYDFTVVRNTPRTSGSAPVKVTSSSAPPVKNTYSFPLPSTNEYPKTK